MKISFFSSSQISAKQAYDALTRMYETSSFEDADVIVVLGGDGSMLKALRQYPNKLFYGMNCGSVGFLLNVLRLDALIERLKKAKVSPLNPLKMEAITLKGESVIKWAINEVSLFRTTAQTAKIRILIDNHERLNPLISDGVLLATPAGSTAYNLSSHGPILPLGSPLLALTPLSPFRPRRWKGAILPDEAKVTFEILEAETRRVSAVADDQEVKDVAQVSAFLDRTKEFKLLFDPCHNLEDRILKEQFVSDAQS